MPRVWFARAILIVMPWMVILYKYTREPESWTWWWLLLPLLLVFVALFFLPLIDRAFLARRMGSIPSAYSLQSYAFSDAGIGIVGEDTQVELKWKIGRASCRERVCQYV